MINNSNKQFDVIIVGGGAAGLLCAVIIKSRQPEYSVAILEAQERVGKKLLTTGNGRCNLTNLFTTPQMYYGSFSKGAEYLLELCSPSMVVDLFEELGLLTYAEDDGRVYPVSKQANSVLDVLRLAADKHNINIICNSKVTDIKAKNKVFDVYCGDRVFTAQKLIVASGSKSTPSTGADDSLWHILKKMGHKVVSPVPALCPVYVESNQLKSLKGVRASAAVRILNNNKVLREESGELQFTENALSGICVFNLSRIANTEQNTEISVSLLPTKRFNEIVDILQNKKSLYNKTAKAEELLIGIFNKMLGLALIKSAGILPSKLITEITDAEIKKLASVINDWRFKVIPAKDFTRSQVTAGGVSGSEIDENNMRSKGVENLYIIGEAVDCDGDCGGMNLQFAFSSAYCAAMDVIL
ncbi:MAG: aminoacetone oxidase family FAD-binding enzyme [Ruminococcus sp.]|nr:aminoacetone oxidase family FAD-binding enzyme [Ruminococcus sp.]